MNACTGVRRARWGVELPVQEHVRVELQAPVTPRDPRKHQSECRHPRETREERLASRDDHFVNSLSRRDDSRAGVFPSPPPTATERSDHPGSSFLRVPCLCVVTAQETIVSLLRFRSTSDQSNKKKPEKALLFALEGGELELGCLVQVLLPLQIHRELNHRPPKGCFQEVFVHHRFRLACARICGHLVVTPHVGLLDVSL
mmetsp:Transcript_9247/g.26309  ORF Transcript_9247/g.26309 Transcript_9247/m.26309 type:complete len:200 (+) Transcript_9247:496-1095(+)